MGKFFSFGLCLGRGYAVVTGRNKDKAMLKKISTKKLVPGMFIADSGINWLDNPYLYSTEGLATEELVESILGEGYQEVFIDTERSAKESLGDSVLLEAEFGEVLKDSDEPVESLPAESSLAVEMPAAKAAYSSAIELSRVYMDGIRRGDNVDLHKAKGLVDSLMGSLARNPDALIGLCKLRDTDDYTYAHSVNVAVLAMLFAKFMQYPYSVQHAVGMSGIFHDLGKALVPIELINAPRQLTDEEFAILRKHPRLGYEQVKKTPGFTQDILLGIYDHHERFNGSGYPRGISGDTISLTGRILAMVDVYDALSSRRPYKEAMLPHKVLGIMYQMRDEDFYPGFMEHFIRMLGIYPVGSVVQLETGETGVVTSASQGKPTKPKVLVVQNSYKGPVKPFEIDTGRPGFPQVTRCLTDDETSIDPGKVLNIK